MTDCQCLVCLVGIETGTSAAAAGGSTTVVDMPLNSHPCTTTAELLEQKMRIAEVGWWIFSFTCTCARNKSQQVPNQVQPTF